MNKIDKITDRLIYVEELAKKGLSYKEQFEIYIKKFDKSESIFQNDRRKLNIKEKKYSVISCQKCGKKIKVINYYVGKKKFCSQECYHKSEDFNGFKKGVNHKRENNSRWKGGNSIGYILSKAKEGVLKRNGDLNKCERCNRKKGETRIVIHHKDRNRQNNNPKNLEVLCYSCHEKEHFMEKHGEQNLRKRKNGRWTKKENFIKD